MAKAHFTTASGTRVEIEGSADEVATLLARMEGGGAASKTQSKANKVVVKSKARPTPVSLLSELIDGGFFKKPKELGAIKIALEEHGHFYPVTTLSPALLRLVRKGASQDQRPEALAVRRIERFYKFMAKAMKKTDILAKIVELLDPLSAEERKRVVRAALTLLGNDASPESDEVDQLEEKDDNKGKFNSRAKAWMTQNKITSSRLEEFFHANGNDYEVIGDIQGKDDKSRTYNAYVLAGIARLLSTGETTFDDKFARGICEAAGCFNLGNHSGYMKNIGKLLVGSKSKGWSLTAPGLKHGAALILGDQK